MNIISPWAKKCPVGSQARHVHLGDVTVLAELGDSREVEAVSLDEDGNEVRCVELVLTSELTAIDPCRDLAAPRANAATILAFRPSSPR